MILLAALLSCTAPEPAPPVAGELIFVRGAVIHPDASVGQPLPGGGGLVERAWAPGDAVELSGVSGVAPRQPECLPIFEVPLGDVSALAAGGGEAPDTALAWSPDGRWLAVGSYRGEVLVVDGWTGEVAARRGLSEALVKAVAWSADGRTLYAGEQSPDALVYALDPSGLATRWTVRLADLVESSPAPAAEDLYGVYTLPGAYGLQVLPGGDLIVAAMHSWSQSGVRRNRSQVLRVGADGAIAARWPELPADAVLMHPVVDDGGTRAAVVAWRTADGPAPQGLPLGGVQVLALPDLAPLAGVVTEPVRPWFSSAQPWEAIDVSAARDTLLIGFNDGRVRAVRLDGTERWTRSLAAPILAGDVPIHATIGAGMLHGDGAVVVTSRTQIPWGAASPELRPPSAHPAENTVWGLDGAGEVAWRWTGAPALAGLTVGDDGRHAVVTTSPRGDRRDAFGALVFDLGGPPRGGEGRLVATCSTAGPVFFRTALSVDGRLAVAEHPERDGEGGVRGTYHVTVLR